MSKKSELLIRAFDKLGKSIVEALAILDAEDSEEEIENLRHENIELKKYLKLAVRDAGFYEGEYCSCYQTSRCPHNCTDSEECVFKYADKVEKLIGEPNMINGKWYSETETASLIETLQKENAELKKYLKLAVDDLSSEAGVSFEYEDEVERLIGGTDDKSYVKSLRTIAETETIDLKDYER